MRMKQLKRFYSHVKVNKAHGKCKVLAANTTMAGTATTNLYPTFNFDMLSGTFQCYRK